MLSFGRDYTLSAVDTRLREAGGLAPEVNGDSLLGYPEYLRGNVALIFATLFAATARAKGGDWDNVSYKDSNQARQLYREELDSYSRLVDRAPDKFRLVHSTRELDSVLTAWSESEENQTHPPVGLVPLMEGGDAICTLDELPEWWERGVHIIGPAWMSTRFCGGTREPGPLTKDGHALLDVMADLGFTLDLSHMDWAAARQALDVYDGSIIASHANALRLVRDGDSNRFLPDDVIERLVERDGIIGVVPFNRFLIQTWKNYDPREACPLQLAPTASTTAVLALGATIKTDRRTIAADAFFKGLYQTALQPDEVIYFMARKHPILLAQALIWPALIGLPSATSTRALAGR